LLAAQNSVASASGKNFLRRERIFSGIARDSRKVNGGSRPANSPRRGASILLAVRAVLQRLDINMCAPFQQRVHGTQNRVGPFREREINTPWCAAFANTQAG
jgi:hypothetical protein